MKQIKGTVTLDEYFSRKIRDIRNLLPASELKWLEGVKHKNLDIWNEFPYFVNLEVVKFILNRLDGYILTLDKPYQISREVIKNLTGLCNIGDVLKKNSIQNKEVKTLTGVIGDQRAMLISTIKDPIMRHIAHGISYKIFFRNREGSSLVGTVYISHKMIMEDEDFDLCGLLKDQLMENVQLEKDADYPFRFGTLVICIMMYFLNCLPQNDNVVWKENEPVCKQIFKHFNTLENCEQVHENFFRELLEKFGIVGISLLVRVVKVGSSFSKVEKKQKKALEFADDILPAHKSPRTKEKGKEQVIVDMYQMKILMITLQEMNQNQLNRM